MFECGGCQRTWYRCINSVLDNPRFDRSHWETLSSNADDLFSNLAITAFRFEIDLLHAINIDLNVVIAYHRKPSLDGCSLAASLAPINA